MQKFVNSRNSNLWTSESGQGVALLLCNGGPGCCDYLEPVSELIADDARVIRWEQSGCGRSDHNPPYTIDACLADMESIRSAYGIEKWIVAGHSWGGDLALMYALRYPENTIAFVCLAGGRFHNDRDWHKAYEEGRDSGREALPEFQFPPNMHVNQQLNAASKVYIKHPSP